MRILLIGEFSGLHRALQAGLEALGHEVVLVSPGDGFKNYPADWSTRARWAESRWGNPFRQLVYRLTGFDVSYLERGLRFMRVLPRMKGFDLVQLIHEAPIQTLPWLEWRLLRRLFHQQPHAFVLACGFDWPMLQHYRQWQHPKNLLNPYREWPESRREYAFALAFEKPIHQRIHALVRSRVQGFIASDLDYALALRGEKQYLGMIPNPIVLPTQRPQPLQMQGKVVLFLGINRSTYFMKGIRWFEQALAQLQSSHADRIEVVVSENVPFDQYLQQFNKAHIVLDMVYSLDQGYNALHAMAQGKVVFTGAAPEWQQHYQLTHTVAIDAQPDVAALVRDLTDLIEQPARIEAISARAIDFVYTHHHHLAIAQQYVACWTHPPKPTHLS